MFDFFSPEYSDEDEDRELIPSVGWLGPVLVLCFLAAVSGVVGVGYCLWVDP